MKHTKRSSLSKTTHDTMSLLKSGAKSVIQANKSVIQNANQSPAVLTKGNVILVTKSNDALHDDSQHNIQMVNDIKEEMSIDRNRDSLSSECLDKAEVIVTNVTPHESEMHEMDIIGNELYTKYEDSDCDSNMGSELSSHSLSASQYLSCENTQPQTYHKNIEVRSMNTGNNASGATILHYAGQNGNFVVPAGNIVVVQNTDAVESATPSNGNRTNKREIRLLKNREAAKECRRKKKEYIRCLEDRVASLESQNKQLIDQLKTLKEMYCSQENGA